MIYFTYLCVLIFGVFFQFQNLPPWLLTVLLQTVCVHVLVRTYIQLMPTAALTNDNQRNVLYSTPQPEDRYKYKELSKCKEV